jgi:hypothetical protein
MQLPSSEYAMAGRFWKPYMGQAVGGEAARTPAPPISTSKSNSPLLVLYKASENVQTLYIYPEDGNGNVCRMLDIFSIRRGSSLKAEFVHPLSICRVVNTKNLF